MYIVLQHWKLAENANMNLFFLLVLESKNHHLYSYARVSMLTRVENAGASTGILLFWFFFRLKTKSVNLGMISAMHTTFRQSFLSL